MDLGKTLAMAAASGMLAACAAGPKAETTSSPSTDVTPVEDRNCCKGRNACKGQSGCKTESNVAGPGANGCRAQGTSCPRS